MSGDPELICVKFRSGDRNLDLAYAISLIVHENLHFAIKKNMKKGDFGSTAPSFILMKGHIKQPRWQISKKNLKFSPISPTAPLGLPA